MPYGRIPSHCMRDFAVHTDYISNICRGIGHGMRRFSCSTDCYTSPLQASTIPCNNRPKEAATILLNPSPLGKGGYSHGMAVTIDILPKQGWQVDKWVGPVYNIDGTTAQIKMDSSLEVAVRLNPTTPTSTTPTTVPTATPRPTAKTSADSYFDKGMEYYKVANWSMAIEQFTKAIQIYPDDALYYNNRGYVYWRITEQGKWREAQRKACSLDRQYC